METSVDKKLGALHELVNTAPPWNESLHSQLKELCSELRADYRLEKSVEEKQSASQLAERVGDLDTELQNERRIRAEIQKECRAIAEALQGEQSLRQLSEARFLELQAETSVLEKQVLTLRTNNLNQAQELEDAKHEISCIRDMLREKETALAMALDHAQKHAMEDPHQAQFQERAAFIPRVAALSAVLDTNYHRICTMVSSRPFTARTEAAVEAVDDETLDDRQPVVDPKAHAASVQALDPAGGVGLPSLEHLHTELGKLGESVPEFFKAIGGEMLHEALAQILEKHTGPHREEDKYLHHAVRRYVNEVIRQLYQDSQQAACDIQQRRELEAHLTREIKASSQQLTKEFLEDRNEEENSRNKKVEDLLSFFLEKLRAVTGGRHEQVLERSGADFKVMNDEALVHYEGLATRHTACATEQRKRATQLRAYCQQKESAFHSARAMANWSRMVCGTRIEDEAAAVKAHLDIILDIMEDTRKMGVLRDSAQREFDYCLALVAEAGAKQERLAQQHEDLAAHYGECRMLLADFEAFVRCGYCGLRAKVKADATAMARDTPYDFAKVAALSRAYEDELSRQRTVTLAVISETSADRQACERQLRAMEKKRTRGGKEFDCLKAQWDEANNELRVLSEDLNSLDQQSGRGLKLYQCYREEARQTGVAIELDAEEFQRDPWVSDFLFNERESTSFQPPKRFALNSVSEVTNGALSVAQSFEFIGQSEAASFAAPEAAEGVAMEGEGMASSAAGSLCVVKPEPIAAAEEERGGDEEKVGEQCSQAGAAGEEVMPSGDGAPGAGATYGAALHGVLVQTRRRIGQLQFANATGQLR